MCAEGRLVVLEWRWMLNFSDLRPSMGTRSVPVTKVRKFLRSSVLREWINYQKYLVRKSST